MEATLGIYQRRDFRRRRDWTSLAQIEVHADSEARMFPAGGYGRFERRARSQQSGAGYDAVPVRFQDASVDAFGHAEIICVYDQPFG
jgi:hypothetical protein